VSHAPLSSLSHSTWGPEAPPRRRLGDLRSSVLRQRVLGIVLEVEPIFVPAAVELVSEVGM
jgi:hypothetical protein